ncbi:tetratricopeptide repeat protein [Sneathiella sp. CAU 1612]|uniref:Tetratricopeptide repeat protein n=1 Tax=Sneathiella sedimenti TaxID=2816034 RepID=A0ABS3F4Z1_9PROT|nr:adenylate/guanylate cyclase domain-containing protein [Sneathiella sedimenti]MBO0333592.1 tetratricopeptide repeat protein [Sneathiella sedimenti]
MQTQRTVRRLAAILAADVVGYSRLMEKDEAGTLTRLQAVKRDILEPAAASHGGRIFKTIGDGFLIEFQSVVSAVEFALFLQRAMLARDPGVSDDNRLSLRIGISLGDVLVDGDDLFGNGVNIAARLEQLADASGICVSGSVFEQANRIVDAEFEPLGRQQVKNMQEPVVAYRISLSGASAGKLRQTPKAATPARPTIAVMPFDNLSGDPAQEYFADGMAEEIITGLSQIKWLTVIGRNSTFFFKGKSPDLRQVAAELNARYLLNGSVRKSADSLRISAQLIEAESGRQLWARRFDGSAASVFDLQDEITLSVIGAIEPNVRLAEIERVKRKRPGDYDAYDLYLQAIAHMYEVTPAARVAALDLIQQALALDPGYAEAHGVAAWCYFARSLWEGSLPRSYIDAALHHARSVQALRSEDASTLAHAAISLAMATRDFDSALEMIARALAINPSSVHAHGHGAVINVWAGHYEDAITLASQALRLSPLEPLSVMAHAAIAGARLMRGEYELALATARRGIQIYPTHVPSHLIMILSLMRLGKLEEARAAAVRFMEVTPSYRINLRVPIFEHFGKELADAGLPEPGPAT